MNTLIVYKKNTGEVQSIITSDNLDCIERSKTDILDSQDCIVGEASTLQTLLDPSTHYIDLETKTIQEKGSSPSEFHTWDYSQKQWIFDPENAARLIRQKRDDLLKQSDWSQGLDVPENLRTVWAVYRNALRNIPQQEGFPEQVTWPTSPEGT